MLHLEVQDHLDGLMLHLEVLEEQEVMDLLVLQEVLEVLVLLVLQEVLDHLDKMVVRIFMFKIQQVLFGQ